MTFFLVIDLLKRMVIQNDAGRVPRQKLGKLEGFLRQHGLPPQAA
jgi:hypothetical protein